MKSTVETKICELVKLGHERADELKAACGAVDVRSVAQLISDLASQLEVQLVRSNALAAKLSMINGLMDAAEQANKLAQEATEKLVQERDSLAAENFVLKQIIDSVTDLSNEPQYHAEGMGCGLEDRGIADRYDACRYGWDEAMERIYGEVIPCAEEIAFSTTAAFLAEVRAQGVTEYSSKRGFSFQHGSIHAHFGNGDVMVGSVTFENGDAGINFAPVREKTGGVGTHYEWTKGKTAEQVDSVFVIASSNAEGLEVIRDKLSEAIARLRKGVQS
ncbi:TPA: hypothetical protein LSH92_004223 [Citrobacter koseri]|nr:hypothetical protein [Citrobacter koseri]